MLFEHCKTRKDWEKNIEFPFKIENPSDDTFVHFDFLLIVVAWQQFRS